MASELLISWVTYHVTWLKKKNCHLYVTELFVYCRRACKRTWSKSVRFLRNLGQELSDILPPIRPLTQATLYTVTQQSGPMEQYTVHFHYVNKTSGLGWWVGGPASASPSDIISEPGGTHFFFIKFHMVHPSVDFGQNITKRQLERKVSSGHVTEVNTKFRWPSQSHRCPTSFFFLSPFHNYYMRYMIPLNFLYWPSLVDSGFNFFLDKWKLLENN